MVEEGLYMVKIGERRRWVRPVLRLVEHPRSSGRCLLSEEGRRVHVVPFEGGLPEAIDPDLPPPSGPGHLRGFGSDHRAQGQLNGALA